MVFYKGHSYFLLLQNRLDIWSHTCYYGYIQYCIHNFHFEQWLQRGSNFDIYLQKLCSPLNIYHKYLLHMKYS